MKRTLAAINMLSGFILIITLVLVFSLDLHVNGSVYKGSMPLDSSWHYFDGETADLSDLRWSDGDAIIAAYFDGYANRSRSLCFMSRNVSFRIYLDNELIYDFEPHLSGYYGSSYGTFLHCIPIPGENHGRTLTLRYTSLDEHSAAELENMRLEFAGAYIRDTIQTGAPRFLLCVIAFFFGVVLFILGLIQQRHREELVETMSLGAISMMLSIWEFPPAGFLQILAGNPAAERAMYHIILMIIPIPVVSFVATMTRTRRKTVVYTYIACCIIDLIYQLSMVLLGDADYGELIHLSHVIIIIGIFLICWMIINALRHKVLTSEQKGYLLPSVVLVVVTGLVDMVRFYSGRSDDTTKISRIGLSAFVIILLFFELKRLVEIKVKSTQAEIMHRLATEDSLTGIKNRTGFNEYEQLIMKRRKGKCLFVHFDVNRLKKVNDTFGHAEGDRHIIAAATVIRDSFGEYGECFRVGGDEFFVILDGRNCDEDYEKCIERCIELQNEYNEREDPPIKLQLAYGMAEYRYDSDTGPEAAEKLADSRMYEKKRQMKADDIKLAAETVLADLQNKEDIRKKGMKLHTNVSEKLKETPAN